jgi:hypothetical protein
LILSGSRGNLIQELANSSACRAADEQRSPV